MDYEPNTPITFADTNISVDIAGHPVEMPAKAILRMLPEPSLVIQCQDALTPENVSNIKVGGAEARTGESLSYVEFGLLNFPEFLGMQDKDISMNGMSPRIGAALLQAPPWEIDITAVPNLREAVKTLKANGGYAVTHTGTIKRSDGGSFSVPDVQSLLEGLRLFLSFARGAFCGVTLVKGNDQNGQIAWERWGTHKVTPWYNPPSWFDRNHGEILSEVFSGFLKSYEEQQELIRMLVGFYVSSNLGGHGVGIDAGLILTQAALERLSYKEIRGKPGVRIAKCLGRNGISDEIPTDCEALSAVHSWKHGPHAVVEIRNNLVHPKQKYGDISTSAYFEAWSLGQWYVELTLLHMFDHNGEYGNRMIQKSRGEVELVPWARSDKASP